MVKGTLKDREEKGATRYDAAKNSWVHVDVDPVATQARIDDIGCAEMFTLLSNVMYQDAAALVVELMYLGYAEQEELYDSLYLISTATTLLHIAMQLYEVWCIRETLAELEVVMKTRDKTFATDSTDEDVLQFLKVNGHKVRRITVDKCSKLTVNALQHIAKACPLIRKLSMEECEWVTNTSMEALAVHCGSITTLILTSCTGVTNVGIKALAERCRSITTLSLKGCTGVTDVGVKALAEHCRSIATLELDGCTDVTDVGIMALAEHCHFIKGLTLNGCTGVTDVGVKALAQHCHSIKGLGFAGCTGVTDVGVKALAEYCRSITGLGLAGCTGVTDVGIMALAEHCRSIRTLTLNGCTGVTDVGVKALPENCHVYRLKRSLSEHCRSITPVRKLRKKRGQRLAAYVGARAKGRRGASKEKKGRPMSRDSITKSFGGGAQGRRGASKEKTGRPMSCDSSTESFGGGDDVKSAPEKNKATSKANALKLANSPLHKKDQRKSMVAARRASVGRRGSALDMDAANEHAQMGDAGRADQLIDPRNTVHVNPLTVMLGKTEGEEKPCALGLGMIRAVVKEKQKAEKKGTEEKKGGEKEKKEEKAETQQKQQQEQQQSVYDVFGV
jgi:hypothetical protein